MGYVSWGTSGQKGEATNKLIEEKPDKKELAELLTSVGYAFNENGDYEKIVMMHAEAEDTREVIDTSLGIEDTTKFVKAEMEPGDFEIAGAALMTLKQKLQSSITPSDSL